MNALISATAIVALAGTALGLGETIDRSGVPIYTQDSPEIQILRRDLTDPIPVGAPAAIYDSVSEGAGFVGFPSQSGVIGVEDYGTTLSPSGPPNGTPNTAFDTVGISTYQFIGGVDQVDGLVFFDFFFNDGNFADSFGVILDQAGNFIWDINLVTPFDLPTEGFHTIFANDDPNDGPVTTGQWLLSDIGANPLVGHNDLSVDNGFEDYGTTAPDIRPVGHNFALIVPAPGAAGLLGLTGLTALRRRR